MSTQLAAGQSTTFTIPAGQSITVTPGASSSVNITGIGADGRPTSSATITAATTYADDASTGPTVYRVACTAGSALVGDSVEGGGSGGLTPAQAAALAPVTTPITTAAFNALIAGPGLVYGGLYSVDGVLKQALSTTTFQSFSGANSVIAIGTEFAVLPSMAVSTPGRRISLGGAKYLLLSAPVAVTIYGRWTTPANGAALSVSAADAAITIAPGYPQLVTAPADKGPQYFEHMLASGSPNFNISLRS